MGLCASLLVRLYDRQLVVLNRSKNECDVIQLCNRYQKKCGNFVERLGTEATPPHLTLTGTEGMPP